MQEMEFYWIVDNECVSFDGIQQSRMGNEQVKRW